MATLNRSLESQPAKDAALASTYPRPQFVRPQWTSLDGPWEFSGQPSSARAEVNWQRTIEVPYPPESARSGIGDEGYHPVVWYRRSFEVPEGWREGRVLLHFGAVDYRAQVWVNDQHVVSHEGGHTSFSADITDVLVAGEQSVVVRVEDDPLEMTQPRGKQDWQPQPHGIWYPRTTGIWQSVWLEPVSTIHIETLKLTPDVANFAVRCEVSLAGLTDRDTAGVALELRFRLGEEVLVTDRWQLTGPSITREVHLGVSGFDDLERFIWSPERPNLIDIDLKLVQGESVLDEVKSYTGLRSVETKDGKFFLNGRPYFLRLALDQGYWDESLLAAPSDEALKRDVELAKALGFNGVRKHQKVEDPRYLFWADKLGLLVWEELPSAFAFSSGAVHRLTKEWLEAVKRDINHPCIVAWVCFNESWGVPDLPHSSEQRHAVKALYSLTKSLDATRPVVGNDGWEHVVGDLLTLHDYMPDPATLAERYGSAEKSRHTSTQILEHGRASLLPEMTLSEQPIILSEFGGIRFSPEAEGWGYQQVDSTEALLERYRALVAAVSTGGLAGFCYTQFADTFQEQNGLLYSDRRPKVDLEALSRATRNQAERQEGDE